MGNSGTARFLGVKNTPGGELAWKSSSAAITITCGRFMYPPPFPLPAYIRYLSCAPAWPAVPFTCVRSTHWYVVYPAVCCSLCEAGKHQLWHGMFLISLSCIHLALLLMQWSGIDFLILGGVWASADPLLALAAVFLKPICGLSRVVGREGHL